MNWFAERRLEWIEETVRIFGFIRIAHIQRKFEISRPQASNDLAEFQRRRPGRIVYDKSAKQYVATRED